MGSALTGVGVLIATRIKGLKGFGSLSNGVIQPLYFLSGSIFPLKGIVGGIGFLDIPQYLRDELRQYGIYAIGGGWVVELPLWLEAIVRANPISYQLDLMRHALLGFHQLPLTTGVVVCVAFPVAALALAQWSLQRLTQD
jgi:ABC-2 type transport system permease protein